MANLALRDFLLNQTTVTGRRSPEVTVEDVHGRYKRDPETRQATDELDGVNVDIIAAKGKIQTVKMPLSVKETTDKIAEALADHKLVTVNFGEKASTLKGRCYAMLQNGALLSGVSCTATEINIVKIEDIVDESFDEIDY